MRTKLGLLVSILAIGVAGTARANCYGSGTYQTCYDANTGNQYSVQRIGSNTYVQGSNASTGSTWSQHSMTVGGTTYTNGRNARGQAWTETQTRIGRTTTTYGTNAAGAPYSYTQYDGQR